MPPKPGVFPPKPRPRAVARMGQRDGRGRNGAGHERWGGSDGSWETMGTEDRILEEMGGNWSNRRGLRVMKLMRGWRGVVVARRRRATRGVWRVQVALRGQWSFGWDRWKRSEAGGQGGSMWQGRKVRGRGLEMGGKQIGVASRHAQLFEGFWRGLWWGRAEEGGWRCGGGRAGGYGGGFEVRVEGVGVEVEVVNGMGAGSV